ncbi:MAG TPA: sugar ABC transporter substrate-binding protein [Vitreimonas sp.]|nr:sugar ABC transporter substrate-binding protein [Vitreimonas sp.]
MTRSGIGRLPVLAAALAVVLAACTGVRATPTPGATGQPVTGAPDAAGSAAPATGDIRYLVEAPENAEDLEPLREHLKDFEAANPGITVELEAIPLEQLRQTLQTTLRGPNSPDVFAWGSGPAYAGALAQAGLLYDLTDAYETYGWPIYEFAKQQVTHDGRVVGVPGEMETIGIFYNKDLFAELGIEQPQNLGELDAAAQKIKDAGKIPFAAADKEGWEGSHWLSMALSSRIGSAGMTDLFEGNTSWNSPDVVAALKIWEDWNNAGYLPPSPAAVTYDNGNALFFAGDAGMVPTGSWLVGDIEAAEVDFEVGYMPFPAEDGPGIWTGGLGSGPYISANTQNPEAALAFVNYLVSQEHGRWVVENLATIPPFPVDTEGVEVSPLFAQVLENTAEFAGGDADFGSNIDVLSTDVFNKAMFDGIQGMLTGQKTAEQVAEDLDAAYKQG